MLNFGKWLLRERFEKGMSQTELGLLLIMDASSISAFERGRRMPNLATLEYMLDKMGYELKIEKKGGNK